MIRNIIKYAFLREKNERILDIYHNYKYKKTSPILCESKLAVKFSIFEKYVRRIYVFNGFQI